MTHDFEEAMAMADRIAVMGEGSIRQVGTPDDIFRRPDSAFVARFVMTRYHAQSIGLKVGQRVYLTFPPSSLHLFPRA